MNNSETKFSIKALKVGQVICVLTRIMGQPLFSGCESYSAPFQRGLAALQREPLFFCPEKESNLSDVCRGILNFFLLVTEEKENRILMVAFLSRARCVQYFER